MLCLMAHLDSSFTVSLPSHQSHLPLSMSVRFLGSLTKGFVS